MALAFAQVGDARALVTRAPVESASDDVTPAAIVATTAVRAAAGRISRAHQASVGCTDLLTAVSHGTKSHHAVSSGVTSMREMRTGGAGAAMAGRDGGEERWRC